MSETMSEKCFRVEITRLEESNFCQKLTQPPSRVFGGAIDESAARFRDDILGTGPEGDLSRAAEGFVLKMFLWILMALS